MLDGVVAVFRAGPRAFPQWSSARAAPPQGRELLVALGRLGLAAAWLLVGAALVTSLAMRERFTLWAAVGETFEGAPGQYLTRAEPRPLSPGPKPLQFEVTGVDVPPPGALRPLRVGLLLGGRLATTTPWSPIWLGGARFLRASGFTLAPRYEIADASGAVLDGAFVKLAILPAGKVDHLRSGALPIRAYVRLAEGAPVPAGEAALRGVALQVDVYRGKVPVAAGVLRPGDALRLGTLALGIPEVRYVAELTLVDDPGPIVLAVALVVGLAALALLGMARRPERAGA